MVGCVLLMMYYTTVSGWMVDYFFRFLTGSFDGLTSEQAAGVFGEMLLEPCRDGFLDGRHHAAGFVVCGRGLQGGLEKVGKWMMSALLVLILVLVVHSFTLSGAARAWLSTCCPTVPRHRAGPGQCHYGGHEPVVLYLKPRHRRN